MEGFFPRILVSSPYWGRENFHHYWQMALCPNETGPILNADWLRIWVAEPKRGYSDRGCSLSTNMGSGSLVLYQRSPTPNNPSALKIT